MSGDGGTSVVAQSESTSSRGLWVLTETGPQEDKGGGGGCGRDRKNGRMSLQELLGCLGSGIGPQE